MFRECHQNSRLSSMDAIYWRLLHLVLCCICLVRNTFDSFFLFRCEQALLTYFTLFSVWALKVASDVDHRGFCASWQPFNQENTKIRSYEHCSGRCDSSPTYFIGDLCQGSAVVLGLWSKEAFAHTELTRHRTELLVNCLSVCDTNIWNSQKK